MPAIHASEALLPSGWAKDVLVEWDDAGVLSRVAVGVEKPASARAARGVPPTLERR